ncbi:MAG: hypothetical protein ABIQ09_03730 [Jatrophihabitantaceae bacterium]
MFSSVLNTKAVRVTTTGFVAAFLAVCVVSVAPGAASTTTAAGSAQASAPSGDSAASIQDDGFHW